MKEYRWPIAGVLFLLLLLAAFVIRLPYYIEMPGTAEDIRSVMTVDGKMDTKSGSYDFVTVAVKEATPADLIYAWATPFTDIYSAKDMTVVVRAKNLRGLTNSIWEPRKIWPSTKG